MEKHMFLKDHLIHLLTLNLDKYITNKNTEASPDQPISHSQTLAVGLVRLQMNPSELVWNWWFVSLCRNTSGRNVSERQHELQLSVL